MRLQSSLTLSALVLFAACGGGGEKAPSGDTPGAVSTPAATPVAIGPAIPEGAVDLATGGPDPTLLPPLESAIRAIDARHRLYGDEPRLRALVTFAADEFESDGIPSGSISVLSGASRSALSSPSWTISKGIRDSTSAWYQPSLGSSTRSRSLSLP